MSSLAHKVRFSWVNVHSSLLYVFLFSYPSVVRQISFLHPLPFLLLFLLGKVCVVLIKLDNFLCGVYISWKTYLFVIKARVTSKLNF